MKAVRDALRSRTFYVGLILIVGYWFVVRHLPTKEQNEFLRIARTVAAVAVSVAFMPGVLKALSTPWPSYGGQLVLGIVLSWVGVAGSAAWVLLWSLSSQPAWMLNSDFNGFWLWLQILGAILHLTARNSVDGETPKPNWIRAGLVVAGIALIAITFMATVPDTRDFVEFLRRYLSDDAGLIDLRRYPPHA